MNPSVEGGEGVERAPSPTIERRYGSGVRPTSEWEPWNGYEHITRALLMWLTDGEADTVLVRWRDGGVTEFRLAPS